MSLAHDRWDYLYMREPSRGAPLHREAIQWRRGGYGQMLGTSVRAPADEREVVALLDRRVVRNVLLGRRVPEYLPAPRVFDALAWALGHQVTRATWGLGGDAEGALLLPDGTLADCPQGAVYAAVAAAARLPGAGDVLVALASRMAMVRPIELGRRYTCATRS